MKFRLVAGAEIDLLTEEEMRHALEDVKKELAELRLQGKRELVRRFEEQGTADGSGNLTITIPGPRQGMEWEVRRYIVCGPDPSALVVCSTVRVYRSEASRPFNLVDMDDGSPRIVPAVSTWSRDELNLLGNEPLIFVFTGLPATQKIYVAGQVVEFKPSERRTA